MLRGIQHIAERTVIGLTTSQSLKRCETISRVRGWIGRLLFEPAIPGESWILRPSVVEINAVKIVQYFAYTQWRDLCRYCLNKNVSIIGDMPIYVALDSADTWSNPELFKLDDQRRPTGVSGVPPDFFSATGQLWNNPVYNWPAHEALGFSWWVQRMRRLFSLYDFVRIDHFRGLVQYWEIPVGATVNGI